MKYIVSGDLTIDKIQQVVRSWNASVRPYLKKKKDYYLGKQAILDIPDFTDSSRKRNRIVANYCKYCVQQYTGYNVGVPVTYQVDKDIQDFLAYNDVADKDNELLKQGLIYGKSYELQYIDKDKKNRFITVDAQDCIEIYSDNIDNDELLAFIRFYMTTNLGDNEIQKTWKCDIYTKDKIKTYKCGTIDLGLLTYESEIPHYFGQVPVVVYALNSEEQGIFEQIMSLQDAYNSTRSDGQDNQDANADSYLILKGFTLDDEVDDNGENQLDRMRHQRALEVDTDGDVYYLQKPDSSASETTTLDSIREDMFMLMNCPNFWDEHFSAQTGIALRYKLVGFDDVSKDMMNRFEKALRKRIELFASINKLQGGDASWRDAEIIFTQNVPVDEQAEATLINSLWGKVPKEDLIGKLPFIKDAKAAIEQVNKENETQYSFPLEGDDAE